MEFLAPLMKDAYKVFHKSAYKPGVTHVYSNFTNRFNTHSNMPNNAEVLFVGLQYFILDVLIERWNDTFFNVDKDIAVNEYSRVVNAMLGKVIAVDHIEALHDLQYLPLEIKAVPEGTLVPYGVPSLSIVNTVSGFGWLTNMIETVMSAEIWPVCTSATTALAYRKRFEQESSLDKDMIPFMGHDFSYRGMFGTQAAAMSGFGHLCSFAGSDVIPAALFAEKYYGAKIDKELVFASVDATEHSVQCSYGNDGELDSLLHLITNVTPTGIISIVSDTWDFWKLVGEYLPAIKDTIMNREGTVVIRPDSGDPVDILCGISSNDSAKYLQATELERKGLIECLWDIFGGTEKNGLKLLDSHIGAIYGDSITLERQDLIINKLVAKGFVPNVVLGIGSYTYQYVTRDTHGSAMKATDIQFGAGNHQPIFKDPKTDSSKKSAKGLLRVCRNADESLYLMDSVHPDDEGGELKTVFKDGKLTRKTSLNKIRKLINDSI
jgi:nicotinamide phosphoribosyltransferase